MIHQFFLGLQVMLAVYFIGLNLGYVSLNVVAMFGLMRYMQRQDLDNMPVVFLGIEPPVSILAPAYNEEATAVASVRSLLQINYGEFEIIVINDGSKDATLAVLTRAFDLRIFPEAYEHKLETKEVRGVYQSAKHPSLRVIDKDNGGKADSLNAGINCARYPLFCAVDADSILQRDSLLRVVQPFLEDPTVVASGGTVRIANGCVVEDGFLVSTGLPRNPWALFQIVEYIRASLFGRLGWAPLNALLIVSGAFGVFRKDVVTAVGGYLPKTIGEDMELVVRMHKHLRYAGTPYKITFVPDPSCWTEAPEDLQTLKNQRVRWQRGLGESLSRHLDLLFNPKAGTVGWLAMPFFVIFEWLGPLVETTGTLLMITGFLCGFVSTDAMAVFLLLAVGLGVMLSASALLMEEISFHIYPRFGQLLMLFLAVILENFGYRQLNAWWRLVGLYRWATGTPGQAAWGEMKRSASWNKPS
ncbi:MAG: glycosyl transferase [Cyanobacteria bacterium RYN_339]|nr:glycosyl transferase [Cyanobacteria bacterium RYN_339]